MDIVSTYGCKSTDQTIQILHAFFSPIVLLFFLLILLFSLYVTTMASQFANNLGENNLHLNNTQWSFFYGIVKRSINPLFYRLLEDWSNYVILIFVFSLGCIYREEVWLWHDIIYLPLSWGFYGIESKGLNDGIIAMW